MKYIQLAVDCFLFVSQETFPAPWGASFGTGDAETRVAFDAAHGFLGWLLSAVAAVAARPGSYNLIRTIKFRPAWPRLPCSFNGQGGQDNT